MAAIALPILFPFLLILVFLLIRSNRTAQIVGVVGSAIMLSISVYLFMQVNKHGILTLNMGGWQAPMGITLVADYLSTIMLIVSSFIVLAISIYAIGFMDGSHKTNKFYIFFFSLVMGVNGAFITGDVFNLYVWFEVILMSSFVLIVIGNSHQQLEGGIKYMALNLLGSLMFLAGLGLLYGEIGTLNMAHLAQILRGHEHSILVNSSTTLFFIAFGIKAAVFPLFFWLPASYHTANITVTALFAGLLTKIGVYALIRFFTLFFVQDQMFWLNTMLVVAGFTMIVGGMAASAHYDVRRILSYHIISQIGYMIMGLAIFTPMAIAGAIFFTIHNMVAKTNTFLVAGMINKARGSFYLKDVGGLMKESPLMAILFIIPAFALAGVPPLSGFFAKFILFKGGIDSGQYIIVGVAVLTAMLTLFSMIKIWSEAFLKEQPTELQSTEVSLLQPKTKLRFIHFLPSIILGLGSILLGIFAEPVYQFTAEAANQLIEPNGYINSVLNQNMP